jgi:hypothetical protein
MSCSYENIKPWVKKMCILGEKIQYACVMKQILHNFQQSNFTCIKGPEIVRVLQNFISGGSNRPPLSVVCEK